VIIANRENRKRPKRRKDEMPRTPDRIEIGNPRVTYMGKGKRAKVVLLAEIISGPKSILGRTVEMPMTGMQAAKAARTFDAKARGINSRIALASI